jgi:hypothetical protein
MTYEPLSDISVIRAVALAASAIRLYPDPTEQPAFERAMDLIGVIDLLPGGITFEIHRGSFTKDGEQLDLDESLEKLATDLFERGIEKLVMKATPEPSELLAIATLATADPEVIEHAGGSRGFLAERGCTAFEAISRDLHVEARDEDRERLLAQLPEELRLLLRGDPQLAEAISAGDDPQGVLDRLGKLFRDAVEAGVDRATAYSSVAAATASFQKGFRRSVVKEALARGDDFAMNLMDQLSDSDLTDDLASLAKEIGVAQAFDHTQVLMSRSQGRRDELMTTLVRRLREGGTSDHEITKSLERVAGESVSLAVALTKTDIQADFDVSALIAEAAEIPTGLSAGISLLVTLLKSEGLTDASAVIDFVEDSVRSWILEGNVENAVSVLGALAGAVDEIEDADRRRRIEDALRAGVTPELVTALLDADEERGLSQHLLETLREHTIPALLDRLGAEDEAGRRRSLVDMLAQVASSDLSMLVGSLDDSRWYLVRNVVTILGQSGDPDAVPHILKAASHSDPRVRKEALRALRTGDDEKVISVISRHLQDRDASVRSAAVAALGANRGPGATQALRSYLTRKPSLPDTKAAIDSLAFQGTSEATTALERLARKWWPPSSRTKELAQYAKRALSQHGGVTE